MNIIKIYLNNIEFNLNIKFQELNKKKIFFKCTSHKNIILNYNYSINFFMFNLKNINNNSNIQLLNFWFLLYKQILFSKLIQLPSNIKTISTINILPVSLLSYIMFTLKNIQWKRYYLIFGNEIIEMLLISLYIKNTKLFSKWLKKYFEKVNLKKHKKLFLFIRLLLYKLIWNYNTFLLLKGVKLSLKGKFAKAGSIRKTRKYIRVGKISYTQKNLSLFIYKTIIRTATGVFNLKLEIFY